MRGAFLALLAAVLLAPANAALADDPFDLTQIDTQGRTAAAEIVDVNGDGLADLVQVRFLGFPPRERRSIRVFLQDHDKRLPRSADFELPLPPGCSAYDLADVLPEPGVELILLRPDRVTLMSLARTDAPKRDLSIPGGLTLGAAEDERGLDRLPIANPGLGDEPWLIIPKLNQVVALSVDGEQRARLDVGARTNYFVRPQSGPMFSDGDIQLMLDAPRLALGDVDGDGRADFVSSGRHEVRVFLQNEDGGFPRRASRVLKLKLVSEKDHIRGSGSVAVAARDIDADGRLDLLVSHVSGGLTDARSKSSLYMNREGAWNLAEPDQVFDSGQGWGADQLLDVDGDGQLELLQVTLPISVLELVELLITQAFDAKVRVYQRGDDGRYESEPWLTRKLDIPFSFETSRPKGFVPSINHDLNGDGHGDLLLSGAGDVLEIWLGGKQRYKSRNARQKLDSTGRFRSGDLDGDGLLDFVIYDPRRVDVPVLIGRNRGSLPGTLPRVGAGARAPAAGN